MLIALKHLKRRVRIGDVRHRFQRISMSNDDIKITLGELQTQGVKMIAKGECLWRKDGRQGRVPVIHTLTQKGGIQYISLFKGNSPWIDEETYRWLEEYFAAFLIKILPQELGVDPDSLMYTGSVVEGADRVRYAYNKGAWGSQHCEEFSWSGWALHDMQEGSELRRWCSRCSSVDSCAMAVVFAANRKHH